MKQAKGIACDGKTHNHVNEYANAVVSGTFTATGQSGNATSGTGSGRTSDDTRSTAGGVSGESKPACFHQFLTFNCLAPSPPRCSWRNPSTAAQPIMLFPKTTRELRGLIQRLSPSRLTNRSRHTLSLELHGLHQWNCQLQDFTVTKLFPNS